MHAVLQNFMSVVEYIGTCKLQTIINENEEKCHVVCTLLHFISTWMFLTHTISKEG